MLLLHLTGVRLEIQVVPSTMTIILRHRLSHKHLRSLLKPWAWVTTASISVHFLVVGCTVCGRRIAPCTTQNEIRDGATSGCFIKIVLLCLCEARLVCCPHELIVRRSLLGASGLLIPCATINAYRPLLLALCCGRGQHRFTGKETWRPIMRFAQSICRLIIFHH